MNAPVFVLKPVSPGYKEVQLMQGSKIIGRSSETGIKSQFVSRKHIEIVVEKSACKAKYCGKHKSEVTVNGGPVAKDWVNCPVGARLEFLSNPSESFPYVVELYSPNASAAPAAGSGFAVDRGDHDDIMTGFNCPMCMDLYVDPTELDCDGRHLFCHNCILGELTKPGSTGKCPVCNTKISKARRSFIVMKNSNKRGRSNDTNGGNSAKKYQSQAVSLVQNTIEWIIERRLCDYDDETEWRRRKGLEPLPAPKVPKSTAPVKGGNGYAPRMAFSRKDRKADPAYGGASSEVIDLLSDSD